MIGNDVVDLVVAFQNSRWNNPRFQNKIFSEKEKQFISKSGNPQFIIWLFWSMKEAAYKANQRIFYIERKLNPLHFQCELLQETQKEASGIVSAGENRYFSFSFFDVEKIHTIATTSEALKKVNYHLETTSSAEIKQQFLQHFSAFLNLEKEELHLNYNQHDVPEILYKSEPIDTAFSFSSHGRFSAYAFAATQD